MSSSRLLCSAVLIALLALAGCGRAKPKTRSQSAPKTYHFSVDDVSACLQDLATHPYHSLFDQPTLGFLQRLHQRYGTKISLYVFYRSGAFDLTQMPTTYRQEFAANADWLKLGFHSRDANTRYLEDTEACAARAQQDYLLTAKEIKRFAGDSSLTPYIRLHLWRASDQALRGLKAVGVRGLLVGQEAQSRTGGLSSLQARTGLIVIATDLSFEGVPPSALEEHLAALTPEQLQSFEGFLHESFLKIRGARNCLEKAAQFFQERSYLPLHYEHPTSSPPAPPSPSSPAATRPVRSPSPTTLPLPSSRTDTIRGQGLPTLPPGIANLP